MISQVLCLITSVLLTGLVHADEGMWPYNNIPKDTLKAKYGFEPSQQWLDHLMKSSVRFNSGGSGSFISSDGLVLTNHHVASDTLSKISTPENDYHKKGYLAKTLKEEIKAHDLELNMLVSIEDVTKKVQASVTDKMTPAEAHKARLAIIAKIESESLDKTGLRSDVVTLYQGGAYHLYRYKKYTDVRLVFAPEVAIAFFGGDPDNFEYPRYDLDMAIFRVYENGKPAVIENYLKWSSQDLQPNDLVFVSGHPGSTDRLNTLAALKTSRDKILPYALESLRFVEKVALDFAKTSPEHARQGTSLLFGVQNSRKVIAGQLEGLKNGDVIKAKAKYEKELKSKIAARPDLKANLTAWKEIEGALKDYESVMIPYSMLEGKRQKGGFNSTLFKIARTLVRMVEENKKANEDRLPEFKTSARESLEQELYSAAPIYKDLEEYVLTRTIQRAVDKLGKEHPATQIILNGKTAAERATELTQTKLYDVKFRKDLAAKGQAGIDQSNDPMIVFAKALDSEARKIRKQFEDKVESVEKESYPKIARSIFALEGTKVYPDATFTLRLAFGVVKGYKEKGKELAPWTTLGGAFDHEKAHDGKEPWKLPETWHAKKKDLDLKTPFNFVSTTDIIGGNSGSPVVNRQGELVGLIFDGNIYSLISDVFYEEVYNRAISVDARGMVETLRKIYGASDLANSLGK